MLFFLLMLPVRGISGWSIGACLCFCKYLLILCLLLPVLLLRVLQPVVECNECASVFNPCVNKEVLKFNRQVKKVMKLESFVKLLEIKLDRNHFTGQLAMIVDQRMAPISIPWKVLILGSNNTETVDTNIAVN